MSGDYGSSSGQPVHPDPSDLSVELTGTIPVEEEIDLVWTAWEARLVYSAEMLSDDLGTDDSLPELVLAEGKFASIDFERLREAGFSLDEALDAYSQDYAEFCVMADDDGIADDLQDVLAQYATGMVIADRIRVPEPFRGRRYGLFLTTVVLIELGRQRVAVAMPAAFEVQPGSPDREDADRRNAELWKAFGFEQYRQDQVCFLDTGTNVLEENLRQFKAEIEAASPILLP